MKDIDAIVAQIKADWFELWQFGLYSCIVTPHGDVGNEVFPINAVTGEPTRFAY